MASSPLNGERPPLTPGLRRSSTLPTRSLSVREQVTPDKSDATADILYSHPQARIFTFSPPKESIKSKTTSKIPPDTDYPVDTVETLPWRSRTESTAAAGRLMIEKVRGSTNFLKCQDIMHAILRNSQCWCVDGESKFVLRVRAFQYYRIELPSTSEEDKSKVEELKKVLPTVLRYERTPCPFIRAFHVDLPDDAITPRRKGAWKRRDSSQPNTPEAEIPSIQHSKTTRSWSLRTPPSAYPKKGPGYLGPSLDRRSSASHNVHRRGSLLEHTERPDSPASNAPSDEAGDLEITGGEHDQEHGSDSDELPESPAVEDDRGRQTTITNRDGRSVSVSARVAAFEHVRAVSSTRPKLDRETSATGAVIDMRPQIKSSTPSTSPLRVSQLPSSNAEKVDHHSLPEQTSYSPRADSPYKAVFPAESVDHSNDRRDDLKDDPADRSETEPNNEADLQALDSELTASIHSQSGINPDDTMSDMREMHQDESAPPVTGHELGATELQEDAPADEPVSKIESPRPDQRDEAPAQEESEDKELSQASHPDVAVPVQFQTVSEPEAHEVKSDDNVSENHSNDDDHDDDEELETLSGVVAEAQLDGEESDKHSGDDENDGEDDNMSTVSSVDSFHTMTSSLPRSYSDHEPTFTETPRGEQQNPFSRLPYRHKREESQMTVTASANSDHDELDTETPLPRSIDDQPGYIDSSALNKALSNTIAATPGSISTGIRQRVTGRRSFSPLPPASTLLTSNQQRSGSDHHLTRTILQNVILKPIEAIAFVVQVLSRIAGGATVNDLLSGELFRNPDHGRRISGFADRNNILSEDDDTDDDYGIPIRGRSRYTDEGSGISISQTNRYERDNDADSFMSID